VCLPPGAGLSELLEFASVLHMSPFDTARPLWQAVLVEGLPDGKAAYLLKFHHAMADGQGAVQLFDLVHSRTAAPSLDKVAPPRSPADPTTSTALALRRSGSLLTAPARGVRVLARQAVASIAQPQSTLAYLQSLARVTASPGTPSPLLRQRGLKRRLRLLEVDLASLRAAGKAAGGTLNDAYLAGLLGGLGRYHAVHGTQVGDLPIALPVSLRHEAHSLGGNQFAGAYLAGPAGEPDPAVRIRKVHERVLAARAEPALDFLGVTAGLTSRLPSGVLAALSFKFASAIDLQASNIPGLDRAAFLAGSRIERMFVFGPVPGSAIMATLLSHEGTCCIGIAMDNDAVPDPDVLLACLRESFDEVLGA
jgi:diacylglycerol O-acyltransferase